eukprot:3404-Pelagococcus_subviridis.AAC.1
MFARTAATAAATAAAWSACDTPGEPLAPQVPAPASGVAGTEESDAALPRLAASNRAIAASLAFDSRARSRWTPAVSSRALTSETALLRRAPAASSSSSSSASSSILGGGGRNPPRRRAALALASTTGCSAAGAGAGASAGEIRHPRALIRRPRLSSPAALALRLLLLLRVRVRSKDELREVIDLRARFPLRFIPLLAFLLELVRQSLAFELRLEHLASKRVDLVVRHGPAALAPELLPELLDLALLALDERALGHDLVDGGVVRDAFRAHRESQRRVRLLRVRRRGGDVAHDRGLAVAPQRGLEYAREFAVPERNVPRGLVPAALREEVDDASEMKQRLVDVRPLLQPRPLRARLQNALASGEVDEVQRRDEDRVSRVRGRGVRGPRLDDHAEDGVRPRRRRVHVCLSDVPPRDALLYERQHLRRGGDDLLFQAADVHAAVGVFLDLQPGLRRRGGGEAKLRLRYRRGLSNVEREAR